LINGINHQNPKSKVTLTTIDDFKDGLLADKEHLKSLCPTNTLLPRISIQNDALPFLVEQLCQAVLHLKSLQNTRESLSILKKKRGKTTINVFRIPASECSLGIIDGAEFFQWTYRNHQAQLWYCPSINSLRPIGANMRQIIFDLRKKLISPPIFVP
jgi:hypothetical protein